MAGMHLPQLWFNFLFKQRDKKTSEPHDLKAEGDSGPFDEAGEDP